MEATRSHAIGVATDNDSATTLTIKIHGTFPKLFGRYGSECS